MLKKILSNTIVRLILAVLIGLLVGLVVNRACVKSGHDHKTNYGTDYFLLGSVDHSRIRGTIHRPLKKQRIQSLIIRF